MTITSELGLVNGFRPLTAFYKASSANEAGAIPHAAGLIGTGNPAAFIPGSPGLSGANVDGTTNTLGGTLPFVNTITTNTYNYISKISISINGGANAVNFFDLLWYNSGINITTLTSQTINSITLPPRDASGTTNGAGVYAWLYVSVATGNSSAMTNISISYTNSAGVSGRTGNIGLIGLPATAVVGTIIPFNLQTGDLGIQSIQNITIPTTLTSGSVNLMLIRDIVMMALPANFTVSNLDWALMGSTLLYSGTALSFWVVPLITNVGVISGSIVFSQG